MKYGGKLIHRVVDDYGPIEVVEAHGVRSLHFGSSARQSAMDLSAPDQIELAYLRSLLIPLLFVPRPRRILLLGLGGGTLAKFFQRNFPEARIQAVELRSAVVDIASAYFGLEMGMHVDVHIMDAHQYLQQQNLQKIDGFDLILVDIFDAEGPSGVLDDPDFFIRLSRLLCPQGAMAVNLWSGDGAGWRWVQRTIEAQFRGHMATLSVPGRGNRICMALGDAYGKLIPKHLEQEARRLERCWGIEFVRLFERLECPLRRSQL